MPKVRFVSEALSVEVPARSTLREAAIHAGIELYRGMWTHLNCRGNGICGRCKVWVLSTGQSRSLREKVHRVRGLQRLACQVSVESDLEVRTRPLGPPTVQLASSPVAPPAYLSEAEQRLAQAREDLAKEAAKKAKEEAAKPRAAVDANAAATAEPQPAAAAQPPTDAQVAPPPPASVEAGTGSAANAPSEPKPS